jgi:hypothetical protein
MLIVDEMSKKSITHYNALCIRLLLIKRSKVNTTIIKHIVLLPYIVIMLVPQSCATLASLNQGLPNNIK